MLCERCKKNNANVHITKVINGEKQELNVCNKCASEMGDIYSSIGESEFVSPYTFQNLLSGLMDYMNGISEKTSVNTETCKKCGNSYLEFKEKGLAGCSECYKSLINTFQPVIKRVQGNVIHTGKIPKRAGKHIIKRNKIQDLKEKLKKVVEKEEYEKAAELRDMIKELEKDN
ncbi:UvrB/UvrC motif-containing protein [Clostridium cochlearium]|jgi:protein arginine kinase activator|uniref:ClpC ATPase n=1 Tax=Clostridium cochlearium TaxID=1494 RepID=A0A2X2VY79_CLOCO|nr:UvrB/UvrC motif-containing protein [Clostridium cochlearium]MBV1819115.1 UvrB/UvrC motif-containing protein [Bacteroidales bacterium MSK.15.36]NSJ91288.1 excinuclease [Coprococcus sp. MSK.21.13]MBE6065119.1 excinuclease [Clostridium cochlearium]MBU5269790.1 UvrB/UvrC motif-containing protein [Clostridium cochlearium]MCG4572387.1 UvrB/UvrC motif-containing protein [Clostridium cochlearium]